jgi:2-C-methyl-D-erythritol 2,4-cyclodiphosphate synthase
VVTDSSRGVEATSDGDVAAHALCDALLGAAGLGDLGTHFPSSDGWFVGADSMGLLGEVVRLVFEAGWRVGNADVTVVSQSVRVSPVREEMRERLAGVLDVGLDSVSVKATTTDGMGAVGRDEGVAATAVVLIYR